MPYSIVGKCLVGEGDGEQMFYPLHTIKRVFFTRSSNQQVYIDMNGLTLDIVDSQMSPDPATFKAHLKTALLAVEVQQAPLPSAPAGNSLAELQSRITALRTSGGGSKKKTRRRRQQT
jgi:hypothetical protein